MFGDAEGLASPHPAGTWLSSSWPSLSPLALNMEQDKALEAHHDGLRAAAWVPTTLSVLPSPGLWVGGPKAAAAG